MMYKDDDDDDDDDDVVITVPLLQFTVCTAVMYKDDDDDDDDVVITVPLLQFKVSHGSAYTVVRATQQINGKWQFWGVRTL